MVPIDIDGLNKEFPGDVLAVDDLDLRIESGEIFGFLGPNGAGKSTTINVLLGFAAPTAGSVTVLGQDVQGSEFAQARARIGVLPEGYSLYDRLSAREHVDWVARTKRADDDPDAVLERVGIGDVADRRVGGFSKGMCQRLAFGMALVGDPDLLVLDEPSSGLDPTGMQEMRAIIREEAATGTTVFFSSHVLPEVEAVCDRVGIMNDGRLVAVDEIEALRNEITSSSRITLVVRSVPDEFGLEDLDGVTNVRIDGSEIRVDCRATTVKPRVVRYIDDRATITDIVSEEPSLEELFNRYTGEGDAPDEETTPAAEVTA
ncbi:copper ABC transporter ATP-binding protein [Halostagnicola sp. A56]|uniref:ABC transporter ATP-binding protein n=1 Tax=Halostagnicola sp. A56 TaxID=1495067 RepID=UPI00049F2D76|nr:ABC transporter ATP-binding protein [Halostagnicola sp. A56]KDE57277.1 copper ABC transporter ATP-binding protein [Halostagnicola sp. A56]